MWAAPLRPRQRVPASLQVRRTCAAQSEARNTWAPEAHAVTVTYAGTATQHTDKHTPFRLRAPFPKPFSAPVLPGGVGRRPSGTSTRTHAKDSGQAPARRPAPQAPGARTLSPPVGSSALASVLRLARAQRGLDGRAHPAHRYSARTQPHSTRPLDLCAPSPTSESLVRAHRPRPARVFYTHTVLVRLSSCSRVPSPSGVRLVQRHLDR